MHRLVLTFGARQSQNELYRIERANLSCVCVCVLVGWLGWGWARGEVHTSGNNLCI